MERLAEDLQKEFPGTAGLSSLNPWRMRAFYSAYRNQLEILSQAVTESSAQKLSQAVTESAIAPPEPMASLPWGHNIVLLHKLESNTGRFWYAHKAIEHGWSRAVLTHHIETQWHKREGKAVTNFQRTLAPPRSDLAGEVQRTAPTSAVPSTRPSRASSIAIPAALSVRANTLRFTTTGDEYSH